MKKTAFLLVVIMLLTMTACKEKSPVLTETIPTTAKGDIQNDAPEKKEASAPELDSVEEQTVGEIINDPQYMEDSKYFLSLEGDTAFAGQIIGEELYNNLATDDVLSWFSDMMVEEGSFREEDEITTVYEADLSLDAHIEVYDVMDICTKTVFSYTEQDADKAGEKGAELIKTWLRRDLTDNEADCVQKAFRAAKVKTSLSQVNFPEQTAYISYDGELEAWNVTI